MHEDRTRRYPWKWLGAKWLGLSASVLLLDQATKAWAVKSLVLHEPVALAPGLNLVQVHNTGAAFGLLSEVGGGRFFLAGFSLLACAVILYLLLGSVQRKSTGPWPCGLAFVLGGAAGNLWDRLVSGYVIDFIDVYYRSWHWPTFNLADTAITVGAFLLVWESFSNAHADAKRP